MWLDTASEHLEHFLAVKELWDLATVDQIQQEWAEDEFFELAHIIHRVLKHYPVDTFEFVDDFSARQVSPF